MSSAASPSTLPTSTHVITVPFPSQHAPTQIIAHITRFEGPSYLIWCGGCDEGWTGSDDVEQLSSQTSSSLLIEEHHPRTLSSNALTGRLADEWAVAMLNNRTRTTSSTSLFRSSSDLSNPMAARLSKRFTISQLFLSLSLPADLISALHGPYSASEGNKALLMIEGALGDILKQTII